MLTFGPITNASTNPTAAQTFKTAADFPGATREPIPALIVYQGTFASATITPVVQAVDGSEYVPDTDGEATEVCRRVIYLLPGESLKFSQSGATGSTSVTVLVY